MLENIVDIGIVAGITALVGVFIMALIQYGEFAKNKYADGKEVKFSLVPYLLIPLVAVAVSTVAGLFIADTAVDMGYIAGDTQIVAVSIIGMFIVYGIADKYCLSDIEDAVYKIRGFRDDALGIVADTVEETVSDQSIPEILEFLAKQMRKK